MVNLLLTLWSNVASFWFRLTSYRFETQRFPFNWKTPIGYLVAVALQIIVASFPLRYLSCFMTFPLGGHLFTVTIANDVIADMKSINDDVKIWKSETYIYTKLLELIHLHSDGKQLSGTTNTQSCI